MDRKKCGALEEIVRLDSFVKNPELKKASLRSACDTLRTLRGGDYDHIRGTLLAVACAKLLETSRPGPDLESLVGEIPPTASQAGGDPSGNQARILVFVEICDRFRGEKGFRITPGLLMALLELGSKLAAGSSPSATGGRSIRRDLWRFVRGLLRRSPPEAVGGHVDRAIKQLLNSIAKTYSRGELSHLLTALRETSKARLNPQIQDHLRLLQPRPLYRIIWVFLVFVFLLTGIVCFFVLYFFRKLISALG